MELFICQYLGFSRFSLFFLDVRQAMALIKEYQTLRSEGEDNGESLKIEDILPFFPDSVRISDFKVCVTSTTSF